MQLRDWRHKNNLSLEELASRLGLSGRRMAHRYETGELDAPAPVVEAINVATSGAVTPNDMHQTRINWLRENGRFPALAEAS